MRKLTSPFKARARLLQTSTLRGFDGGWNVDDDDLNLAPRFLTRAKNVYCSSDGTVKVRQGLQKLANLGTEIVNMTFFSQRVVAVLSDGRIYSVDANGTATIIWNNTIASLLPGAPSGWGATPFASFAPFNGSLIVCNGIDKPLEINKFFVVDYLQDPATGTNINVPVARYVIAVSRYLVFLGDAVNPNRVHISARDAPGTWFGDPPPNDATFADVGSNLADASVIRGGMAFRGKLLVFFAEGTLVGTLGNYNEANEHVPDFNDAIEQYGCISHRAAIASGDDGMIADFNGISSIKRTILSTSFKPEPISNFINPEYTAAIAPFNVETLEDRIFAVLGTKDTQYMLFVPDAASVEDTTETRVFVNTIRNRGGAPSWSEYRGWNLTCGCRSLTGNLIFGDKDGNIWIHGNRDFPVYLDDTTPIDFEWETPWLDMGARGNTKHSKYVGFDTRGTAEFTAKMFVDRYEQANMEVLSLDFSGGSQGQYGNGPQPFGGGRNTSYERLYAWTAKFKLAKFRFVGQADAPLSWVSIILHYQRGSIRR